MKNWQETNLVFGEILRLSEAGRSAALATIVRLEGSAYRQPGAKLLVREDGRLVGNVSGGCLENDLREIGLKVMKGEKPRIAHYDTSGKEDQIWGLGVGCGGKVDLLVQSCRNDELLAGVRDALHRLQGDEPFALATDCPSARLLVFGRKGLIEGSSGDNSTDGAVADAAMGQLAKGESAAVDVGGRLVFIEVLAPPPRLVVCGANDSALPLVALATQAGFRVIVVDHRKAYLGAERFPPGVAVVEARPEENEAAVPCGPNVYAVVMSHIQAVDRGWVHRFAAADMPYIGLLGSRSRRDGIMEGLTAAQRQRVFGPVGLDIGAEGPEQVAVSIVSELLAVWSGHAPRHLRDRERGIHQ